MPRGRPKKVMLPLTAASTRLRMFEKAGLTDDRLGTLLSKIVDHAEQMLDNPDIDPFAKAAWAKLLVRDIFDVKPPKMPGLGSGAQTPVIINIGAEPPKPRLKLAPQAPVVIDMPHNAP